MMMNKFIIKRMVILSCLVLFMASQAFGAGIVLKIAENGLEGWSAGLDPNYDGTNAASANIEFFTGSIPAPISTDNRFEPAYTWLPNARDHQYDDTIVDGANVYIRSWEGPPLTEESYYGKSSAYRAASGSQPALQYNVASFKTDFLAAKPKSAPTIGDFSESNVRVGDTDQVNLQLTMPYSYSRGSPKIEATGYDVKFWLAAESEPADDDQTRVYSASGGSFSLPGTDAKTGEPFGAGTYNFKVRAKNWFGEGPWSASESWTTLSGVGGVAEPFTFDLESSSSDKLVVNSIAIPHNLGITQASDLVALINEKAKADPDKDIKEDVVIVLGRWDPEAGGAVGYYPETGEVDFVLVPGEGYQVYVKQGFRLVLGE